MLNAEVTHYLYLLCCFGYKNVEGIIWCQEFKQKVPGFAAPDFTHDSFHGTETLYMAAAI